MRIKIVYGYWKGLQKSNGKFVLNIFMVECYNHTRSKVNQSLLKIK